MRTFLLFSLLIITSSCTSSSKNSSIAKKRINAFVDEYSSEYQFAEKKEQPFLDGYKKYLKTVYKVLDSNGNPKYFETYMAGLRNSSEIITNAKFNLPAKWKREKRTRANPKSEAYLKYEAKAIGELYVRLEETRIQKIKKDLKAEIFSDLESNHQKYEAVYPL